MSLQHSPIEHKIIKYALDHYWFDVIKPEIKKRDGKDTPLWWFEVNDLRNKLKDK